MKLPRCPCGSQRCERLADRQWGQVQCSVSPLSIDSSATSTVSSTPPQHSSRAFHFQGQQCSRSHERSWNASCCHSLPRDFSSTLLEFKAHILGITSSFFIYLFFLLLLFVRKCFWSTLFSLLRLRSHINGRRPRIYMFYLRFYSLITVRDRVSHSYRF